MRDRRELDRIIFEVLGMTKDEELEPCQAVVEKEPVLKTVSGRWYKALSTL